MARCVAGWLAAFPFSNVPDRRTLNFAEWLGFRGEYGVLEWARRGHVEYIVGWGWGDGVELCLLGAPGGRGGVLAHFPLYRSDTIVGLRSPLFLFGALLPGIRFRTTCESTGAWSTSRKKVTAVVCLVHVLCPRIVLSFFLMHRSHSLSFTRAQGIPKYKIGIGRGKGWESWGRVG